MATRSAVETCRRRTLNTGQLFGKATVCLTYNNIKTYDITACAKSVSVGIIGVVENVLKCISKRSDFGVRGSGSGVRVSGCGSDVRGSGCGSGVLGSACGVKGSDSAVRGRCSGVRLCSR